MKKDLSNGNWRCPETETAPAAEKKERVIGPLTMAFCGDGDLSKFEIDPEKLVFWMHPDPAAYLEKILNKKSDEG
jgi:hypothetical protein